MDISFDLNSIIGALLAASIPIYVGFKQIKGQRALEKEMFFRQEKIKYINFLISEGQLLNHDLYYLTEELSRVFKEGVSEHNIKNIKESLRLKRYNELRNFGRSIVGYSFDEDEVDILNEIEINKLSELFVENFTVFNIFFNALFDFWDFDNLKSEKNLTRYYDLIGQTCKLIPILGTIIFRLEQLNAYNLNKMTYYSDNEYYERKIKQKIIQNIRDDKKNYE
ncbi:hypothetical protein QP555_05525 [Peptoniphilus lacrimalis]|uniref:hypothetical protein n=1 Tax=Peptoniphilus lacrimalis TaxID=33031 RepID=UPI00254D6653|nr:hypothetical protein [Peptoniphilus lacrimalis]MDK7722468.1 hypothetical protein [Peptoniphilus lacrimalis]MDK7732143.1 hypothetical protein [Peptoniphilus lacrimalis]